ncbi:MAG: hypothetical protein IKS41_04830 [Alphaproteobacteria bacterium]|nr:hypothetical protein [Alphaproteobacteria bacterium]
MKKIIIALVAIGAVVLAACGETIYEKEPVGIGPAWEELKKSPCACLKLEKAPELPAWFS